MTQRSLLRSTALASVRVLASIFLHSSCALAILLNSCTSFAVVTDAQTEKVLKATEVTGLHAERVPGQDPAKLRVRLTRSGTRSYEATTQHSPSVEYTHDSLITAVWDWDYPQALPLVKMLLSVVALPADGILWIATGPITYARAPFADTAPYATVALPVEPFQEPLPKATSVKMSSPGGVRAITLASDGAVTIALPEIAKAALRAGERSPILRFALADDPKVTSSLKFTLEELAQVTDKAIRGSDDARLRSWQAICDACPVDAAPVHAAMSRFVAPLREKIRQRDAERVRVAKLRREAAARQARLEREKVEELARLKREREELEARRKVELAARRARQEKDRAIHAERMAKLRTFNLTQIPKVQSQLATLRSNPAPTRQKLQEVMQLEISLANSLRTGRFRAGDPRARADREAALGGFARAARLASDLDDLDALESMARSLYSARKEMK